MGPEAEGFRLDLDPFDRFKEKLLIADAIFACWDPPTCPMFTEEACGDTQVLSFLLSVFACWKLLGWRPSLLGWRPPP